MPQVHPLHRRSDPQQDGSFSFDPTNSAYDSLADGQSEVITVNYQVNDGDSGTSDVQSFDITVLGTNDAPVADYTTADVLDASKPSPQEGDALMDSSPLRPPFLLTDRRCHPWPHHQLRWLLVLQLDNDL